MSLLLANLVLLLLAFHPAVAYAAVGDGTQHHQRQSLYQNVFFSELPRMKGRPSTSFVMVRISIFVLSQNDIKIVKIRRENKPLYQLNHNGYDDDNISTKKTNSSL